MNVRVSVIHNALHSSSSNKYNIIVLGDYAYTSNYVEH